MAEWYSRAERHAISVNYNEGGNSPRLLVVHIMQGSLDGTNSWFHNPQAQASAHFGVGKNGEVFQWVGCDDMAWHAANANSHSVGVEHEGFAGTPLTQAQLDATAGIYAWCHKQYPDIDMWLNENPSTGSGLSWHGLGGSAWGGHTGCPGQPIVNQLPTILKRAKAILSPPFAVNPPTGVSADARYTQADISWNSSNGADNGYDIAVTDPDGVTVTQRNVHALTTTFTNLQRGTTYTFTVWAKPAESGSDKAEGTFTTN